MAVLQKASAPNAWVPLWLCPILQCPYGCAPNAVPLVPATLDTVLDLVNSCLSKRLNMVLAMCGVNCPPIIKGNFPLICLAILDCNFETRVVP